MFFFDYRNIIHSVSFHRVYRKWTEQTRTDNRKSLPGVVTAGCCGTCRTPRTLCPNNGKVHFLQITLTILMIQLLFIRFGKTIRGRRVCSRSGGCAVSVEGVQSVWRVCRKSGGCAVSLYPFVGYLCSKVRSIATI